MPAVFLIATPPRPPIGVELFTEFAPRQRLCMANVIPPPAWPADRFNKPSCLAKREINAGDPGPRPLQRQLKRREIGPLFQITGTETSPSRVQCRELIGLRRVGRLVKSIPKTFMRSVLGKAETLI